MTPVWFIEVPIIESMDPRRGNIWEHTPLDFWRGEYPRFQRPVGSHRPRTKTIRVLANTLDAAIDKVRDNQQPEPQED